MQPCTLHRLRERKTDATYLHVHATQALGAAHKRASPGHSFARGKAGSAGGLSMKAPEPALAYFAVDVIISPRLQAAATCTARTHRFSQNECPCLERLLLSACKVRHAWQATSGSPCCGALSLQGKQAAEDGPSFETHPCRVYHVSYQAMAPSSRECTHKRSNHQAHAPARSLTTTCRVGQRRASVGPGQSVVAHDISMHPTHVASQSQGSGQRVRP